ncbi:hypothetical protein BDN72DRAFT_849170 [Pluteus cervinus]|uniref:Uncharacterized protein n=1 Tax=Pluteus cervinus TaxID=181527 RepID=A0ACD3AAU6_9AGAR|nr:hypothetical protein BDN72DRAFT_849170 [Pluteus cervinus]
MAPAYYTSGTSDEDTPPSSDATTPPRSSTPSTSEHSEDDQSQGEEESSDTTSNATTNDRESTDNCEEELKDFWASIKKAKELWTNFVLVWGEDSLGPEIAEFSRDVLMNLAEDESQIPDSLYVMPVALYHPISLTHSDASHSLRQEGFR